MRVAIIGTGFAARLRAEALQQDNRCQLVAVVGRNQERTQTFANRFGAKALYGVDDLLSEASIDLVFVSTVNCLHADIARQVLQAGKHTVVEYPLAFDLSQAQSLISLAEHQQLLLHVEHVELLSGIHLALQAQIPSLGDIFYIQYTTIAAAQPAPRRWSYNSAEFGFPLVGAISRVHRLMNLFGPVERVSCQLRYQFPELQSPLSPNSTNSPTWPEFFSSCLCSAQLSFQSGAIADLLYAKGERLWRSRKTIEVHGSQGSIQLGGEQNAVIRADGTYPIEMGSRRGLFYKDTRAVIQNLLEGIPLYTSTASSIKALEIALAAQKAAATNQTVSVAPKTRQPLPQQQ